MAKENKLGMRQKYLADKEQESLREQYNVKEDIIIVERKNAVVNLARTVFKFALAILRIIATIAIVVLAVVGLSTIIFPVVRQGFMGLLTDVLEELRNYIPFL